MRALKQGRRSVKPESFDLRGCDSLIPDQKWRVVIIGSQAVLKTVVQKCIEGSSPSLSAICYIIDKVVITNITNYIFSGSSVGLSIRLISGRS